MKQSLGLSQLKAWEELVECFSKTWSKIESQVDTEAACLPLHWYDVLFVLSRSPNRMRRSSEIADMIVTSRAALSRSLDKLEDAGYITKQKCTKDGRGLYAVLTDNGFQQMKKTWPIYKKAIQNHFGSKLSSSDAKALTLLLSKIK
jgi:DNA-binding MarR family transcriptional regulator